MCSDYSRVILPYPFYLFLVQVCVLPKTLSNSISLSPFFAFSSHPIPKPSHDGLLDFLFSRADYLHSIFSSFPAQSAGSDPRNFRASQGMNNIYQLIGTDMQLWGYTNPRWNRVKFHALSLLHRLGVMMRKKTYGGRRCCRSWPPPRKTSSASPTIFWKSSRKEPLTSDSRFERRRSKD